ncbi:hypothetical protein EV182_003447 [Spiromyces aspiralis]|uniref:Uncharacterized protein n=1 Tax=Spiromyces aspiralis TaxID=68401 RepID=A0ACC1HR73_9FUNG|nr:hypothetical protein EV182_003447 [Spiromyces aspiralis]
MWNFFKKSKKSLAIFFTIAKNSRAVNLDAELVWLTGQFLKRVLEPTLAYQDKPSKVLGLYEMLVKDLESIRAHQSSTSDVLKIHERLIEGLEWILSHKPESSEKYALYEELFESLEWLRAHQPKSDEVLEFYMECAKDLELIHANQSNPGRVLAFINEFITDLDDIRIRHPTFRVIRTCEELVKELEWARAYQFSSMEVVEHYTKLIEDLELLAPRPDSTICESASSPTLGGLCDLKASMEILQNVVEALADSVIEMVMSIKRNVGSGNYELTEDQEISFKECYFNKHKLDSYYCIIYMNLRMIAKGWYVTNLGKIPQAWSSRNPWVMAKAWTEYAKFSAPLCERRDKERFNLDAVPAFE